MCSGDHPHSAGYGSRPRHSRGGFRKGIRVSRPSAGVQDPRRVGQERGRFPYHPRETGSVLKGFLENVERTESVEEAPVASHLGFLVL